MATSEGWGGDFDPSIQQERMAVIQSLPTQQQIRTAQAAAAAPVVPVVPSPAPVVPVVGPAAGVAPTVGGPPSPAFSLKRRDPTMRAAAVLVDLAEVRALAETGQLPLAWSSQRPTRA